MVHEIVFQLLPLSEVVECSEVQLDLARKGGLWGLDFGQGEKSEEEEAGERERE